VFQVWFVCNPKPLIINRLLYRYRVSFRVISYVHLSLSLSLPFGVSLLSFFSLEFHCQYSPSGRVLQLHFTSLHYQVNQWYPYHQCSTMISNQKAPFSVALCSALLCSALYAFILSARFLNARLATGLRWRWPVARSAPHLARALSLPSSRAVAKKRRKEAAEEAVAAG